MSLSDARSNLLRVANAGNGAAFCEEDRRVEFRRAIRSFTAAYQTEHPGAPPVGDSDDAWNLVLMAEMAGVAETSDLAGPMRSLGAMVDLQSMTNRDVGATRDAMRQVCPELVEVYRSAVALNVLAAQAERQDRTGAEREVQRERYLHARQRVEAALLRVKSKMESTGWTVEQAKSAARAPSLFGPR